MGQYLSSPVTDKEIVAGEAEHVLGRIDYAVASHQGWRRSQEDAHVAVQLTNEHLLFGVYDGRGGHEVAHFCSLVMPKELPTLKSFLEEDYARSLITVFHLMDEKLRQGEEHGDGNRANRELFIVYWGEKEA